MDILKFARTIGQLKTIQRTGWVREGIQNPEDVADHSFRIAILAMVLGPKLDLNTERLVQMALIHDIGEITTTDIVVDRGLKIDINLKKEKEEKEAKALEEIFNPVNSTEASELYQEMIAQTTREAKIMRQLDKLEMVIQALEYEKEQGKKLDEFFQNAQLYITEPILKDIFEQIQKERL